MGAAGAIAVGVLLLPAPAGFGRSGPAWWVLALAILAPAGFVYAFSLSTRRTAAVVAAWRAQVASAANEAIQAVTELAASVQKAVVTRRGVGRLAAGLLGLRRIVGAFGEITGSAAPAAASMNPTMLGLTALAVVAGFGVAVLAALLVLIRVIV